MNLQHGCAARRRGRGERASRIPDPAEGVSRCLHQEDELPCFNQTCFPLASSCRPCPWPMPSAPELPRFLLRDVILPVPTFPGCSPKRPVFWTGEVPGRSTITTARSRSARCSGFETPHASIWRRMYTKPKRGSTGSKQPCRRGMFAAKRRLISSSSRPRRCWPGLWRRPQLSLREIRSSNRPQAMVPLLSGVPSRTLRYFSTRSIRQDETVWPTSSPRPPSLRMTGNSSPTCFAALFRLPC